METASPAAAPKFKSTVALPWSAYAPPPAWDLLFWHDELGEWITVAEDVRGDLVPFLTGSLDRASVHFRWRRRIPERRSQRVLDAS